MPVGLCTYVHIDWYVRVSLEAYIETHDQDLLCFMAAVICKEMCDKITLCSGKSQQVHAHIVIALALSFPVGIHHASNHALIVNQTRFVAKVKSNCGRD